MHDDRRPRSSRDDAIVTFLAGCVVAALIAVFVVLPVVLLYRAVL